MGGLGEQSLNAWEYYQTAVIDAEGMTAAKISASPQLMDLQLTLGTPPMQPRLKFDQPVNHRVFRREILRSIECAGQKEHGAAGKHRLRLQLMDKFL